MARAARKLPCLPKTSSLGGNRDVSDDCQSWDLPEAFVTAIQLTVRSSQTTSVSKLVGRYPQAIVLDGAVAPSIVDGDVDLGCPSVQRVSDKTQHDTIQRGDDDGRFELVDDMVGKRLDGHGLGLRLMVIGRWIGWWYRLCTVLAVMDRARTGRGTMTTPGAGYGHGPQPVMSRRSLIDGFGPCRVKVGASLSRIRRRTRPVIGLLFSHQGKPLGRTGRATAAQMENDDRCT